jgi:hypothetical protein
MERHEFLEISRLKVDEGQSVGKHPADVSSDEGAESAPEWHLRIHHCDRTDELPSKAFMRWRTEKKNAASPESHNGQC